METETDPRILAAMKAIDNAGGAPALAADILSLAAECGTDQLEDDRDDMAGIDIRLQIVCLDGMCQGEPSADPDDWSVRIWTGLSDCDTDHRGYWGAGCAWSDVERPDCEDDEDAETVYVPMSAADALAEAERIIDDALDSLASSL